MKQQLVATIRNQLYQILKSEITSGAYEPGQKLLEQELAEKYSVSRSPIRDALHQLAGDGLVVDVPNKGVFVKEFTVKDIEEIYDVRVLLETYAIERLRDKISQESAARLLEILEQMVSAFAQNDLGEYIRLDTLLHGLIVELCGNTMVIELYAKVADRIRQFRRYSLVSNVRFVESVEEHRDIVHSIIRGNTAEANSVNCRHLQLARDEVVKYLLSEK